MDSLKIPDKSVLIWVRQAGAQGHGRPELDMNLFALQQIMFITKNLGRSGFLIGDEIGPFNANQHPLLKFWTKMPQMPEILGHEKTDSRVLQMYVLTKFRDKGCVTVGMRSGILEPNAMLGMPTISIEGISAGKVNTRLRRYVGRLPGWKALETVGDIGEDAPAMPLRATRKDLVRLNRHLPEAVRRYNDEGFIALKKAVWGMRKLRGVKSLDGRLGIFGIREDRAYDDAAELRVVIKELCLILLNRQKRLEAERLRLDREMDDLKPSSFDLFAEEGDESESEEEALSDKDQLQYDKLNEQHQATLVSIELNSVYLKKLERFQKEVEGLIKKLTVKKGLEQELSHQKLQLEEMYVLHRTLEATFGND